METMSVQDVSQETANEILAEGNRQYREKNYAAAIDLYESIQSIYSDRSDFLYNLACTYALVGQRRKALNTLRESMERGYCDSVHARNDSDFNQMKNDPEFLTLIKMMVVREQEEERKHAYGLPIEDEIVEVNGTNWCIVGRPTENVPESARAIDELFLWNNQVFIGHGDGMDNKGPVPLISYDPDLNTFTYHFMLQEHVIQNFRIIDNNLWIAGAEPYEQIGGRDYRRNYAWGNIFSIRPDGSFVKYRTIPAALHTQDIAKLGEQYLCSAGTANEDWSEAWGRIYVSDDKCQTWKTGFDFPLIDDHVVRAGKLITYNDSLYGWGFAFHSVGENYDYAPDPFGSDETIVFDGVSWTEENLFKRDRWLGVRSVFEHQGQLILTVLYETDTEDGEKTPKSILQVYDGTVVETAYDQEGFSVRDVFADETYVYILVSGEDARQILKSEDLKEWSRIADLPLEPEVMNFVVEGDKVIIGDEVGTILLKK